MTGGPRDDPVFHAGKTDVLSIDGATGRDVEAVDDVGAFLADVTELRGVLEAQAVGSRNGDFNRILRQVAIAEPSTGRLLDDLVILRFDVGDRNAPALGGSRFQHHARRSAALTHRFDEVTGRAGAVGVLVAVFGLVARRLHDLHSRPISFQLVGDDQRHAGANALAHFGAMADDGHGPVRRDGDEC
jgi:hypothetical protein